MGDLKGVRAPDLYGQPFAWLVDWRSPGKTLTERRRAGRIVGAEGSSSQLKHFTGSKKNPLLLQAFLQLISNHA